MFFILTYGNFSFQIYIPLCRLDKKFWGKSMNFAEMPNYLEIDKGTRF